MDKNQNICSNCWSHADLSPIQENFLKDRVIQTYLAEWVIDEKGDQWYSRGKAENGCLRNIGLFMDVWPLENTPPVVFLTLVHTHTWKRCGGWGRLGGREKSGV